MKMTIGTLMLSACVTSYAAPLSKFITVDKKVLEAISSELASPPRILAENSRTAVLELKMPQIEELSHKIHGKLRRCGGFMAHDTFTEATVSITNKFVSAPFNLFDYSINQQATASSMVEQVSEEEIRKMIVGLSEFESRHYESESGTKSSSFILETWKKLSSHRKDVQVELLSHSQWSQPSIVLTIQGSEISDEIVILGGHADSIAMDGDKAPGADDNASGISSVTEVIRLLMTNNFKPRRTIQFMAYAAEEVGLLGSREIARNYRKTGKKVVGVMQLDMTLFKGTKDKDIILISDFTNKDQNIFIGKLIDEYVKVPWGFSRCGYGCSDHASWSSMGYPASFPFETSMEEHNPNIHTVEDTLDSAGGTADHAVNFTKLATAYVVEMAI